ncbi:MAG TPA: ABC transporter permease [Blastocatellia bacterium]
MRPTEVEIVSDPSENLGNLAERPPEQVSPPEDHDPGGGSSNIARVRSRPSHKTWGSIAIAAIPFFLVLLFWHLSSADSGPRSIFLPSPGAVIRAFGELFSSQAFIVDIGASVYRVTAGFMLAAIVAVPLGLLAGSVKFIDRLVQPINDFTRYLPVPAFIPLLILWVGIGDAQKILVIFIGTVFQVIPLVADTAANVPSNLIDLGYTSGASRRQILTKVVLPWCAPTIYDHLRVALGWAWGYLVIAELVAATSGIGHVIIQAQRFIQTPRVMAGILTIGLIGLFFDLCFKLPKRKIFPWL